MPVATVNLNPAAPAGPATLDLVPAAPDAPETVELPGTGENLPAEPPETVTPTALSPLAPGSAYLQVANRLSEIADAGSAAQAAARAALGIGEGAMTNPVALPSGFDAAGEPGDFHLDPENAHLWIYTGDGETHTWLRFAGVNAAE